MGLLPGGHRGDQDRFWHRLRNVASPIDGAIDIGIYRIPAYRTVVGALAILLIFVTAFVFDRTPVGIKIRAMVQNREVASLLGLNVALMYQARLRLWRIYRWPVGGLIAPMYSVDPYMGNTFLVRSFFVVIVGGIGQLLAGTLFWQLHHRWIGNRARHVFRPGHCPDCGVLHCGRSFAI